MAVASTPLTSFIAALLLNNLSQIKTRRKSRCCQSRRRRPRFLEPWTSPLPSFVLSRVNPEHQFSCLLVMSSLGWSLGPPNILYKIHKIRHIINVIIISLLPSLVVIHTQARKSSRHRKFWHHVHLSTKEPQLASHPWLPPADSRPHRP